MKKSVTIRVREEMIEKLRVMAEEEGRTLSGQIGKMIRDVMEEKEKREKDRIIL